MNSSPIASTPDVVPPYTAGEVPVVNPQLTATVPDSPELRLPPPDTDAEAKDEWRASLRDQIKELCQMTPERMATLLTLAGQNLEQIKRDAEKEPAGRSATRKLLAYVRRQTEDGTFEFFRSWDDEAYVTICSETRNITVPILSSAFKQELTYNYLQKEGIPPSTSAIQDVVNALEAEAMHSEKKALYIRAGWQENRLYIDLAMDDSRCIEISSAGWKLLSKPPIRFLRPKGITPLPIPVTGGRLEDDLLPLLNVQSIEDFILAVAWIVATLHPTGPYPILSLNGGPGSAKSFGCGLLKSTIDPCDPVIDALPPKIDDLILAAHNAWISGFDNVRHLTHEQSDTLCRIATGSGVTKRKLYKDSETVRLKIKRPMILNGVPDFIAEGDLADRSMTVTLNKISKKNRKKEKVMWAKFNEAHPKILGALCDAVVTALKNQDQALMDEELPRMADFASWVKAAEDAFAFEKGSAAKKPDFEWKKGDFIKALTEKQAVNATTVIDSLPWLGALQRLLDSAKDNCWKGTTADLLKELNTRSLGMSSAQNWPKLANKLSGDLRNAADALRTTGIDVTQKRVTAGSLVRVKRGGGDAGDDAAWG